ncbi:ATP-dependent RNA helicase DBP5 [Gracilariopsis chorda]|uniref:RNA helicase n=1 Tax=Gracilariopsis chorda TaxID=448386 RepID=A0A2V3IHZ3_9FLOR|nr:ATP-dependent RNA helicase DBP5 [Gracilariopsis chorda]|eukprot:PXF41679.1 ATP-dependent RNA helicase DBP5 [Gracilariopsis chorda]
MATEVKESDSSLPPTAQQPSDPEDTLTDDPSGEKANAPPRKEKEIPSSSKPEEDWAESTDELTTEDEQLFSGIDPGDETSRIQVLQADPTTPYYSANTFEELGLSEELMKGIYHMKFSKPSKIQATSLPMIISSDGEYKNLIAQAHNGSGKSASFVLGMLSRINYDTQNTQALCLVPTRELARQIRDVIMALGKFTQVTAALAIKATEEERKQNWASPSTGVMSEHIVVGTPGKVMEFIKKRKFDTSSVKILVVDEADEMVDMQGMGDQTIRIRRNLPKNVQVLLFSATYKDAVRKLATRLAPNANQITIKRETLSLDKVQQYYIDTGNKEERYTVLSEIYELLTLGQSIIFVRTRHEAHALTQRLRNSGHTVSVLYGGDMSPEERDRVIDEFRAGITRVLITTNVLSRGVDVLAVNAVINYDLPTDKFGRNADPETYLHRIGRTGRFGRKGIAINFVYDDRTKNILKDLEDYYSRQVIKVTDVEELSERIEKL